MTFKVFAKFQSKPHGAARKDDGGGDFIDPKKSQMKFNFFAKFQSKLHGAASKDDGGSDFIDPKNHK